MTVFSAIVQNRDQMGIGPSSRFESKDEDPRTSFGCKVGNYTRSSREKVVRSCE